VDVTTRPVSRFRASVTVRPTAFRWREVVVGCPCGTTSIRIPPAFPVDDAITEARGKHREDYPECPHP
jgi:hypothetical protein